MDRITDVLGAREMNADLLNRRIEFARGQIMEALGDLALVSNIPEVHHAERALRYAIAELNGTARASEPHEAAT